MLSRTGVVTIEDIESVLPPKERMKQGPVAIIECFQMIPCNPCYTSCIKKAIKEFGDINDRPVLDYDKCNGCGTCISNCPGLAIFVVDETYSDQEALIKLPYEYTPLPKQGQLVDALDREGKKVGMARVVRVQKAKALDRTPIISVSVEKSLSQQVRNIGMEPEVDKKTIVCRCEDIALEEIQSLIKNGCTTIDEIKRLSRCGMGPCQGKTCRPVVSQEVARALNIPLSEVKMPTFRQPMKPVKLGAFVGGDDDEE